MKQFSKLSKEEMKQIKGGSEEGDGGGNSIKYNCICFNGKTFTTNDPVFALQDICGSDVGGSCFPNY